MGDGRALADDVGKGVLVLELLAEFLDLPEILKRLDAADNPTIAVAQDGGGHLDGDARAPGIYHEDGGVDGGLTGVENTTHHTGVRADVRPEHLTAPVADGILAPNAGDLLGSTVERGNPPFMIDRENPV